MSVVANAVEQENSSQETNSKCNGASDYGCNPDNKIHIENAHSTCAKGSTYTVGSLHAICRNVCTDEYIHYLAHAQ